MLFSICDSLVTMGDNCQIIYSPSMVGFTVREYPRGSILDRHVQGKMAG
jgi:hypothetical protein